MSAAGDVLQLAAEFACDQATMYAAQRLRHLHGGRNCFYPIVHEEQHSFGVGIVQAYHYLVYQERGFATFPMTWALGRTIPITLWDGSVIFRTCTAVGVPREGYRGYWYRGADGQLVERYEQRRSWVHPGVGPHNFIRDAIQFSREYYRDEYSQAVAQDARERVADTAARRRGSVWQRVRDFLTRSGTRSR